MGAQESTIRYDQLDYKIADILNDKVDKAYLCKRNNQYDMIFHSENSQYALLILQNQTRGDYEIGKINFSQEKNKYTTCQEYQNNNSFTIQYIKQRIPKVIQYGQPNIKAGQLSEMLFSDLKLQNPKKVILSEIK